MEATYTPAIELDGTELPAEMRLDWRLSKKVYHNAADDIQMPSLADLADKEARKVWRNQLNERYSQVQKVFKDDLEFAHGVHGMKGADKLFQMAWEYGHADGYVNVASYYTDLAELVRAVMP